MVNISFFLLLSCCLSDFKDDNDEVIESVTNLLSNAKNIVVFVGAGISKTAGIPASRN
jgi:hypothetical protein